MRTPLLALLFAAAVAGLCADGARADDGTGVRAEIDALKRKMEANERRLRELENQAPTADEVSLSVDRYLASMPRAGLVGGADGGSAGFPLGKKPFIKEGPNSINFIFRNQVRYESFQYSSRAVGVLQTPADTLSGGAPKDRSGFEIERLYFGIEGHVFCEDISYQLVLNFDSDTTGSVEKEFMWLDWQYAPDQHVRAGTDKVPFTYEEQNSSAALAFVDRSMLTKGFALDSDTGVMLWGWVPMGCDCPRRFMYKFFVSTGEGRPDQAGSVFNTDAFNTYADNLLFSGMLEWNITCKDWAFDEVDNRPCEARCHLDASLGASGYYENDLDVQHKSYGMALRIPLLQDNRWGASAWLRARWEGFSFLAEYAMREVDDPEGTAGGDVQTDTGFEATIHYRFPTTNWGVGVKYGLIWLDDSYPTVKVANSPAVTTDNTMTEYGFVVNYFFWDHNNKISADITWVNDNSAVNSSSAGYLVDPKKGVLVEDGVLLRIQWQINF